MARRQPMRRLYGQAARRDLSRCSRHVLRNIRFAPTLRSPAAQRPRRCRQLSTTAASHTVPEPAPRRVRGRNTVRLVMTPVDSDRRDGTRLRRFVPAVDNAQAGRSTRFGRPPAGSAAVPRGTHCLSRALDHRIASRAIACGAADPRPLHVPDSRSVEPERRAPASADPLPQHVTAQGRTPSGSPACTAARRRTVPAAIRTSVRRRATASGDTDATAPVRLCRAPTRYEPQPDARVD